MSAARGMALERQAQGFKFAYWFTSSPQHVCLFESALLYQAGEYIGKLKEILTFKEPSENTEDESLN